MKKPVKHVLFVCVENACRSQMAEAFFNKMAKAARGSSAGSKPASMVNPLAVEVMGELGIDISKAKPKLLTMEMLKGADQVITMGCAIGDVCPSDLVENAESWGIEDPAGKPITEVRRIRDKIKKKVRALVDEIEASS
ncbi:MAG: arsenate reductase ArsC [Candidatus Hadarchaeaceae archaeon]